MRFPRRIETGRREGCTDSQINMKHASGHGDNSNPLEGAQLLRCRPGVQQPDWNILALSRFLSAAQICAASLSKGLGFRVLGVSGCAV